MAGLNVFQLMVNRGYTKFSICYLSLKVNFKPIALHSMTVCSKIVD